MNKKITIITLALALPLTVAAFPGSGQNGGRFEGRQGNRMERLSQNLNLNTEQQSKVEAIFKEQQEKREAIRQETHQRMQEVLTPEQMTQFNKIQKKRQDKWHKRHEERRAKKQFGGQN